MKIQMTYFAQIRKAAGAENETLDLPAGADILGAIVAASARHGDDYKRLVLATDGKPHANLIMLVNEVPASGPGQVLHEGETISLFSPVAGG